MSRAEIGDRRLPERFWAKVAPTAKGCWQWQAATRHGYARFYFEGSMRLAHRLAYLTLVGPIPEATLDHLCRNRACVNPAHLEPVSIAENNRRGNSPSALAARATHCLKGHPFDDANTGRSGGFRECIACRQARRRRKYLSWPKPACPACGETRSSQQSLLIHLERVHGRVAA